MNSTLQRSLPRPPDIEDHEVLQIPRPDELRELALADRLSLRIGLWLLRRAQRPRRTRRMLRLDPAPGMLLRDRQRTHAECYALLTYDIQRGLR